MLYAENAHSFSTLCPTQMGTCCRSIIICNHREATSVFRQANTSSGEFGTRDKDVLGTKKQSMFWSAGLSIVVYRRSWREIFLPNPSDFHKELKSGKGRPMGNAARMGNPHEKRGDSTVAWI